MHGINKDISSVCLKVQVFFSFVFTCAFVWPLDSLIFSQMIFKNMPLFSLGNYAIFKRKPHQGWWRNALTPNSNSQSGKMRYESHLFHNWNCCWWNCLILLLVTNVDFRKKSVPSASWVKALIHPNFFFYKDLLSMNFQSQPDTCEFLKY